MAELLGRKNFMAALRELDIARLKQYALCNRNKESSFSFDSMLRDVANDEVEEIFEKLSCVVIELVMPICKPGEKKSPEQPNRKISYDITVVQAAIDVAFVILRQKISTCRGLLDMIVFLNSVILDLPSSLEDLRNSIALLSEKLFHMNYVDIYHELRPVNILIYRLHCSLYEKATKLDVLRVHTLISKLLNTADVNSNELWSLLKRAASSSLYLSMPEGRDIISRALTIDTFVMYDVHEVMKSSLLSCSLTQGTNYGQVYVHAWIYAAENQSEAMKSEIEISCFRDLVLLAIKEKHKHSFEVLRKVLSELNTAPKSNESVQMLYFIYQPMLIRFVKNRDPVQRTNACIMFFDIFPLPVPEIKLPKTELCDQMIMIKELLLDEHPAVRRAAVIGICKGLSINLDLFPKDMMKIYFKLMAEDLSNDSSTIEIQRAERTANSVSEKPSRDYIRYSNFPSSPKKKEEKLESKTPCAISNSYTNCSFRGNFNPHNIVGGEGTNGGQYIRGYKSSIRQGPSDVPASHLFQNSMHGMGSVVNGNSRQYLDPTKTVQSQVKRQRSPEQQEQSPTQALMKYKGRRQA